jgi:two-component SAPR family response regulator
MMQRSYSVDPRLVAVAVESFGSFVRNINMHSTCIQTYYKIISEYTNFFH